jgi:hypothetical protein
LDLNEEDDDEGYYGSPGNIGRSVVESIPVTQLTVLAAHRRDDRGVRPSGKNDPSQSFNTSQASEQFPGGGFLIFGRQFAITILDEPGRASGAARYEQQDEIRNGQR